MSLDLSTLKAPQVVKALDFEVILQERKDKLVELFPDIEEFINIEGDPDVKVQETGAYRELIHYARVNDAARAVMLAFAVDSDLDHLAALYGVSRQEGEKDSRLRLRTQLAPEGFTGAGPEGGIVFHAMLASVDVKHVSMISTPNTGIVDIAILSETGDGTVPDETYDAVYDHLNKKDVKNFTDDLRLRRATITPFEIDLTLQYSGNIAPDELIADAQENVATLVADRHRIGRNVHRNAIIGAASVGGVENITMTAMAADITPLWDEAPYASAITIKAEET